MIKTNGQTVLYIITAEEREALKTLLPEQQGIGICADASALSEMPETSLVNLIDSTNTMIAQHQALRYRAIAELNRRRRRSNEVPALLAAALNVGHDQAQGLVADADALVNRLPKTLGLLERGLLDGSKAATVCKSTANLSDDDARSVDKALEDRLPNKTDDSKVRRAANYEADKADPERHARHATRRNDAARKVTVTQHLVTRSTSLFIRNCEPAKVAAAYERIDQGARRLKTADETRSMDELRADVALELLLSRRKRRSNSRRRFPASGCDDARRAGRQSRASRKSSSTGRPAQGEPATASPTSNVPEPRAGEQPVHRSHGGG
ncbi:protein of unknown function [Amycolatopsis xylanica]|uniref:DUF222 domain-containing protein n=1 Tax=Amycolatopsis xylanica TaxID=589385 RepID=A0A1H3J5Q0_9PSEU|nr:DUF222 domain-containing protein [Amycolatopsis xylanica]SDY34879.1 protein of unknown function [Amycolatopsis xylanica]